jgi:hypothetical protein
MLHIYPGIVVTSQEGVLAVVGGLIDMDGGKCHDPGFQIDDIAILFFEHPGAKVIGVGQIAGRGEDEGIAGVGLDPVIAAGVGDVGLLTRAVEYGNGRKDFGGAATDDPPVEDLLGVGGDG